MWVGIMDKKKKILAGVLVMVALGALGAVGGWYYSENNVEVMRQALNTDKIYEGISIEGQSVSGLTKEEAYDLVNTKFSDDVSDKKIVFTLEDEQWELDYSQIDAKKDAKIAVDEAYSVARDGDDIKERFNVYNQVKEAGFNIYVPISYDEGKLDDFLLKLSEETNKEAKDSVLEMNNGSFMIEEDVKGFEMSIEETRLQVITVLDGHLDGKIELTGEVIAPKITKEDNQKVTSLLGTYTTKYTGGESLGRNINLKVGSQNVSGTVVAPGEIFSMNVGLGEQTYAGGYRNASVIVNGKLEDGIAGGVCQVTTTLYNAAVLAELEIIERKNHSLAVGYVPLGQDAAVAGTYKDLKFKNNTDYPIFIEAYAKNGSLVTNVYGYESRSVKRTVSLEHVYITSIPKPAEKVKEDSSLPEGERVVTYPGKVGHKVSTYKVVHENGVFVSREWFSDSVYSPVADEVSVGTGSKIEDEILEPIISVPTVDSGNTIPVVVEELPEVESTNDIEIAEMETSVE